MAWIQVYPKLVIDLETTRSLDQIHRALDDVYEDFKTRLRRMADADPQTTIVGWHFHLSTGPVDEIEP